MKELSIVIPVHNEEGNLQILFERLVIACNLVSTSYEFIFVDDGSRDSSVEITKNLSRHYDFVHYIVLSRNFGHQIAVSAGLEFANGNAVVIIDADLQDPPELIPQLYEKYQQGYNVVYAQRRMRKGESFFKIWSASLFYRLLRRLTSIDIPIDTGDFRLIDKKIVNQLRLMPENNKFIRGQISWLGFKQIGVLYDRDHRNAGKSSYPFSKMLGLALDAITGFSDKPLSFVSKMGFFFSGVSFMIILYALWSHFVLGRTITGWTSIVVSTMFIGGIQLVSIGIIGTYISRINKNTMKRPLFVIADSSFNDEMTSKPR